MIFFVYLHKKWYEHILETTNGFEEIPSVWESDCSESMIRESRFGGNELLHRIRKNLLHARFSMAVAG